jgi:hypothetical protein
MRRGFSSLTRSHIECCVCLFARIVRLGIKEAYTEVRQILLGHNCKVIFEEVPNQIVIKQGSLWGISPKTAKKVISYRFSSVESGTRVTVSSKLASDWKNLTIIGSALSILLAFVCLWIAADLNALVASNELGFWSWIAMVDGYVNVPLAQAFADLTQILAVFLVTVVALEVVIVFYVNLKINEFAEETLNSV